MDYVAKIGDIHVKHTSTMAVHVPVEDIVIHEDYSSFGTIKNDIALALLASPVKYSSHIQPVCFPEEAFLVRSGTECWVTGWGKLNEGGETGKQGGSELRPELRPRRRLAGPWGQPAS